VNAVSQKDLDDATGAHQSAKASARGRRRSLRTAKLNLGFTKITSPVTGIAGIAKAQIGDLLSPSMATELTTVSTVEPIKVYFNISEREYLKVASAAIASGKKPERVPLELILVDGSFYPHPGKFSVLNRQVDPTTGTFKAAALFPNPDNLLRPGQYGKIRATMSVKGRAAGAAARGHRNAGQVPGGRRRCRQQGRYPPGERRRADRQRLDHQQGLQPGEQVIAEGTQKVRPGMTVNPKPFVAETPAARRRPRPADKPAAPAPASKG
jgi:membrane fusion protein (multidrug efflux system)